MMEVLKRHVSLCALTMSILFFMHNIDGNVQEELLCRFLLKSYSCDVFEECGLCT